MHCFHEIKKNSFSLKKFREIISKSFFSRTSCYFHFHFVVDFKEKFVKLIRPTYLKLFSRKKS